MDISQWYEAPPNEPLEIGSASFAPRKFSLDLNCTEAVNVFIEVPGKKEPVLVHAAPRGRSEFAVSLTSKALLTFQASAGEDSTAQVFTRAKARSQSMPRYDGKSFTKIAPMRSGNDQVERMAMLMHQNQLAFQAQMEAERKARAAGESVTANLLKQVEELKAAKKEPRVIDQEEGQSSGPDAEGGN